MPAFTADELLATLGLDGVPDSRTLLDRFLGDGEGTGMLREILVLQGSIAHLVELANNRETNEAQEEIMRALGGVVVAQVASKGEICSAVWSLVTSTTRDDVIPPEVRTRFGVDDPKRRASADARLRRLQEFSFFQSDEGGGER
jgi:hypothetical protein